MWQRNIQTYVLGDVQKQRALDVDLPKARRSSRNFTLVVNEWEKTRHSLNMRIHFLANL